MSQNHTPQTSGVRARHPPGLGRVHLRFAREALVLNRQLVIVIFHLPRDVDVVRLMTSCKCWVRDPVDTVDQVLRIWCYTWNLSNNQAAWVCTMGIQHPIQHNPGLRTAAMNSSTVPVPHKLQQISASNPTPGGSYRSKNRFLSFPCCDQNGNAKTVPLNLLVLKCKGSSCKRFYAETKPVDSCWHVSLSHAINIPYETRKPQHLHKCLRPGTLRIIGGTSPVKAHVSKPMPES